MTPFRPAIRHGPTLFALALLSLAAGVMLASAQTTGVAPFTPEEAALPEPADSPPSPVHLPPLANAPSVPADEAPLVLPPGLETLPQGHWRIRFADDTATLTAPAATALATLGRRLAALPEGRITVAAQASGPAADVSIARRRSLARGLAVKQALAEGGLPPTRIDIRALGRTAEAVDVADVLPPPARAAAQPGVPPPGASPLGIR